MTDKMIEKTQDDMQVIQEAAKNDLSLPEAAYRFSKLPKHHGLEDDRVTPLRALVREYLQENPSIAGPAVQGPVPKKGKGPVTDLDKASAELEKLEKALEGADPKWMWSSSNEYFRMKKSVKNLNKWQRENKRQFRDPKSAEYKNARRKYLRRLENSVGKVSEYLDKNQTDFNKNGERRDDPRNQKWEQRRIRSALHSFDTLRTLQGSRRQSEDFCV